MKQSQYIFTKKDSFFFKNKYMLAQKSAVPYIYINIIY